MSIVKKLNPLADDANMIKMHERNTATVPATITKYRRIGTLPASVTSVTVKIDGVETALTFAASTGAKDLRLKIAAALKTIGYDPNYNDNFKSIQITNYEQSFVSELEFVKFSASSTHYTLTNLTTLGRVRIMHGKLAIDTDPGKLSDQSTIGSGTQIGTTGGYATGASATVKSGIETALTAEGITFKYVEVSEDTENGMFHYKIHALGTKQIFIDDVHLDVTEIYNDFVSA